MLKKLTMNGRPWDLQMFAEGDNEITEDQAFDHPAVRKHISNLRHENGKWRKELREAESELTELRGSDEALRKDIQKQILGKVAESLGIDYDGTQDIEGFAAKSKEFIETVKTDATKEVDRKLLEVEIKNKLTSAGIVDPDVAYQLLDKENIKFGEKGEVEGLDDSLNKLKEAKPYLVGKTKDVGGGVKNTTTDEDDDSIEKKMQEEAKRRNEGPQEKSQGINPWSQE